jgi:hypothetical protein
VPVLLEVDLASELVVELLVTRDGNHHLPVWVMEATKGLMIVIADSVVVVAMNSVGADGSAETIGRARLMRHGQQATRSLV